ncbi:MAG: hypothetical protein V7K47_03420 [Nostoc sp.]
MLITSSLVQFGGVVSALLSKKLETMLTRVFISPVSKGVVGGWRAKQEREKQGNFIL